MILYGGDGNRHGIGKRSRRRGSQKKNAEGDQKRELESKSRGDNQKRKALARVRSELVRNWRVERRGE